MIWMYNMDALADEARLNLMNLLNALDEPWRQLSPGDLLLTVQELLDNGQGQLNKEPEDAPDVAFMLMDISEEVLDKLLDGLREKAIDLPYKAMVTANNRSYLLGDLVRHIQEEDREVRALVKLQRLMAGTTAFEEKDYSPEGWQAFQAAYKQGQEALERAKKGDMTPDEVEDVLKNFNLSVLSLLGQA